MRYESTASLFLKIPLFVLLFANVLSGEIRAQEASRPDRGVMPNGSYQISDIENINLLNGNVNIRIPLASLPPIAGGKLSWTLTAQYNSKLWDITREQRNDDQLTWQPYTVNTPGVGGGWTIGHAYSIQFRNANDDFQRLWYEVEFSQGMADIIGSSEHVEYRLESTFQANSCILSVCGTVTKTTAEFGGAATLNKDESLTGNVQIFVSRNATTKAFENMELRRQWGVRVSSDGDALTFTPEQIDAHEYGHAHNVIKFGMRAEPSYRANRWENILRHRQGSSNTRIVH